VLADLPSLDSEQLLLVKSLEEASDRRPVILDRIEDLLVVQEAAHHVRGSTSPTRSARPVVRAAPPVADKALSDELLDQMGSLLAKDSARKSTTVPAAFAAAQQPSASAGARHHGKPETNDGVIVPTDGRRSRGGRGRRFLITLVIVALLAGAGALAWKQTHPTGTTPAATTGTSVTDLLGARLVTAVPAGYVQQADAIGHTGPSDLTKAAHDDGAPDAHDVLVQAGFLHGYQRLWITADKQWQLLVTLYHFRTAAGASAYSQRVAAAASANVKPAPASFAVAGIPGAVGLSAADGTTQSAEAVFTRGIYSVAVVAHGPDAPVVQSVVQQVAAAQYALLPPG
jgi:hypothetical protein